MLMQVHAADHTRTRGTAVITQHHVLPFFDVCTTVLVCNPRTLTPCGDGAVLYSAPTCMPYGSEVVAGLNTPGVGVVSECSNRLLLHAPCNASPPRMRGA